MHWLVDHDHLGAGLPRVPGRRGRAGRVVPHARQDPGPGPQRGLVTGRLDRGLGGLPGLGGGQRVELAGVAVRRDDGDPGVHDAPDQVRVGAPFGAAVRAHRRHGDDDHRGQRVFQLAGRGWIKGHRGLRYRRGQGSSGSRNTSMCALSRVDAASAAPAVAAPRIASCSAASSCHVGARCQAAADTSAVCGHQRGLLPARVAGSCQWPSGRCQWKGATRRPVAGSGPHEPLA